MRSLLVGMLFLFGPPVVALAQTAVDAKNLTTEAFINEVQSYDVALTQVQKTAILDAVKRNDIPPFEKLKDTLSKGDRVGVQQLLVLLKPKQSAVCNAFAEHDDPIIRFLFLYEAAKAGDQQAATDLHALLRKSFTEKQARMLRSMAASRGIVPEKDSADSIAALLTSYGSGIKKLKAGEAVEGFRVVDVDGKAVSLDDLKGKPTHFHFWATWCGPCMEDMDDCVKHIKAYPTDVNVVFVNLDLDRETCVDAIEKIDLKCTHVYGEDQVLSRVFGIKSLPHDAWMDAKGKFVPIKLEDVDRLLGRPKELKKATEGGDWKLP